MVRVDTNIHTHKQNHNLTETQRPIRAAAAMAERWSPAGSVFAVMACACCMIMGATGANGSRWPTHVKQTRNTTFDRLPADATGEQQGRRAGRPLPEFIPDASFYVAAGLLLYLHYFCQHIVRLAHERVQCTLFNAGLR